MSLITNAAIAKMGEVPHRQIVSPITSNFLAMDLMQQMDTTTVIPPDFTARVDEFANLVIEWTK